MMKLSKEDKAYIVGIHTEGVTPILDDGTGPWESGWDGGVIITDLGPAEARRAMVFLVRRGLLPIHWRTLSDYFNESPWRYIQVEEALDPREINKQSWGDDGVWEWRGE